MDEVLCPEGRMAPQTQTVIKRKKKMKLKPFLVAGCLLVLLAAGGLALWQLFFVETPAEITTGQTTYGALDTAIEGTGVTLPADSVTYTLAGNSKILEVAVAPGDMVAVGDLLYRQDDSVVDEALSDLATQFADLEASIDDYTQTNSDTALDIKEYQASIADCQGDIAEIQASMADLTVAAPFTGLVTAVEVAAGDTVNAGTKLATLIDDTALTLQQYFSYAYEGEIAVGMTAAVSLADQMLQLTGTVTAISKVDYITPQGVHCFAATIEVKNPGALTSGLTASSSLTTASGTVYAAAAGTLEYRQSKTITAKTAGELAAVNAVAYGRVTAGDTLFSLDSDSYQSQIEGVEEQIDRYNDQISSAKKQVENNQKQITRAQSSMADLTEQMAETEETRSDYNVYATLDGQVISVGVSTNMSRIQTGFTAVTVYNLDSMTVRVNVDELDIDAIQIGQTVAITRNGTQGDSTFTGTVSEVSLEASNTDSVATFPVTIVIQSQGELPAGVNVSWAIAQGDAQEGVLAPVAAVQYTDNGSYLFVESTTATAGQEPLEGVEVPQGFVAVPVETGTANARYIRILSGVAEGETVFTGYQKTAPTGGNSTSKGDESDTTSTDQTQQGFDPGSMGGGGMNGMTNMGGGNMPTRPSE